MRFAFSVVVILVIISAACSEEPDAEISTDSTASTPPDSLETQAVHHTSPQDAITGAYNLIDEARSVTDEANARVEELEQLMGDN